MTERKKDVGKKVKTEDTVSDDELIEDRECIGNMKLSSYFYVGAVAVAAVNVSAHDYETKRADIALKNGGGIRDTIAAIERTTGYPVFNMPKEEEFHVHLHFPV